MAHFVRADIPFHYALADAFTVCDAYHCSLLGPTEPNRMHMWTGWVGNDGEGGGPVVKNPDATASFGWTTYPERLTDAGILWKIYQDVGHGMRADNYWGLGHNPYIGNYGCNVLLFFKAYQDSIVGSELYKNARTGTHAAAGGTLFQQLEHDVRTGRLPQVSWIIAPGAYSEHPYWPANWGAWYTARILDALTSNPEVWSKTALFLTYDENDGLFDHVVPPTPPMGPALGSSTVSIENEIFPGTRREPQAGPYGLGVRVPMIVISPWSKGGWVSSQVFDHTSLLRFAEQRFGVRADNITPWRREVCGDLTSTFDFVDPPARYTPSLPNTAAYAPPDRHNPGVRFRNYLDKRYDPKPPTEPHMPVQEPGQRPARAVPYELHVSSHVTHSGVTLTLRNTGATTAVFQVRTRTQIPRCYTVGSNSELHGTWAATDNYALEVYGPNGFYRAIDGEVGNRLGRLGLHYDHNKNAVELRIKPTKHMRLTVRDAYTHQITTFDLPVGQIWHHVWALTSSQGWYDLDVRCLNQPAFHWRFAGHVETGSSSYSDPQFSAAG